MSALRGCLILILLAGFTLLIQAESIVRIVKASHWSGKVASAHVATNGGIIVVGGPAKHFIYDRTGKLLKEASHWSGSSLDTHAATSGGIVVIATPQEHLIYDRAGELLWKANHWSGSSFGTRAATDGDIIAIATPHEHFIYDRAGNLLQRAGHEGTNPLGTDVATRGGITVIGAPDEHFIYDRGNLLLKASHFSGPVVGTTVATDGDIIVVGGPAEHFAYRQQPVTSCYIDLQDEWSTCSDLEPIITFSYGPSVGEVVLKVNLDPGMSSYTQAVFGIEYGAAPTGWTMNIGDSISNNGAGGDCGDQSNDAELHIQGTTMKIYGSDRNPGNPKPLKRVSEFVAKGSYVNLAVSNSRVDWSSHGGSAGHLSSPYLYALGGQEDDEGPVNYEIYAAFNRVIDTSGCPPEERRGSGVTHVKVKLRETVTAIDLLSFTARPAADRVLLAWETGSEVDNAGFNLWRSEAEEGGYVQINAALIPAEGDAASGARYRYTDGDVVQDVTYWYKLEDVDVHGVSTFHGPLSATPGPGDRGVSPSGEE
jgi:hypothetical protein